MKPVEDRVAVVGMGGLFPGAGDLDAFWSNVRAGVDGSSDPPPGRWSVPPNQVLDARPGAPDRVPTIRGYYLPPFAGDVTGMDLAAWPLADLDPVFHLALHIGNAAWRSAVTDCVDQARCGVVLGNIALPTEKTNAITLEVLGPQLGLFQPTTRTDRRNKYSTGLPAALVARGLGFGLGGHALDAACASSLYAIKLACDELLAGRADAMVAGGLVRPDSLYTQIGFAQLRALSPTGRCSPFDARADGLVVGEGGCAFVLKRLSDAVAHGDSIHGVIAGIGLSNDVEGNVLQPATEGQLRALLAAYRQAGWKPSDVQFVECHATGTPTGDAIEFESLRQLWQGDSGRAVLGGVKSTVGHLLTGAGAAALAKVLLAFRHGTLPPTANFERPSPKLGYDGGPFRILRRAEPWESTGPRRAAINGFGFGGINAHLLVEEWSGEPGAFATGLLLPPVANAPGTPEAVAVVGLSSRSGSPIESLTVPVARFRIPPRELEEMLPQQVLMLQVAAEALDDTRSKPADGLSTGVFVGISLDPNTTNYHLRWMAGELDEGLKDQVHPALTANRTMGSLGSIAASRVARFLGAGGPSFAVCDEEAGGLRALALAAEALRNGEIGRALVGAVEFATDPRYGGSVDGAAAVILKRLADAERDRDRVYAVVREVRAGETAQDRPGSGGAATGLLDFADVCRALNDERTTINGLPAYWIQNRENGPRRATIEAGNVGRYGVRVNVEEVPAGRCDLAAVAPAGQPDGLFTLTGGSPEELLAELTALREMADDTPGRTARRWWHSRRGRARGPRGLAFTAETATDLCQAIAVAEAYLRQRPDVPVADRIFYSPTPLGGGVAFVYPGSGNHFPDMGRELGLAFPHVLRRQMAENGRLRSQYHADRIWSVDSLDGLTPRDLLFAQVAFGTLVSDLLASFGVSPKAVVPYSLGESAGLFATRAWRDRDEMLRRLEESSLFASDLAGTCDAARAAWGIAGDQPVEWVTGVVGSSAEHVRRHIAAGARVYVQIINTADDCVIGGERRAVEEVARAVGAPFSEVRGVSIAHCAVVRPVRTAYRAFHVLPTHPPAGVRYYSGAWGRVYELNDQSAADAITGAALDTIDFPRLVNAAYGDGARIFVEIGPGASCTRMIGSILAGRPHAARAASVAGHDTVAVFLRLLAHLYAEGVAVDLSVLYGTEERPPPRTPGPTLTLPVGYRPKPVRHSRPAAVRPSPARPALTNRSNGHDPKPAPIAAWTVLPTVVLADTQTVTAQAHEAYLRFASALQGQFARAIVWQTAVLQSPHARGPSFAPVPHAPATTRGDGVPRSLGFEQCMEFARGLVANVLGPRFAEVDSFPTRVRLPDGPLQLVDRVVTIDGEPLSLTPGRLVTEHRVHEERWYLENYRAPGCISIEAGQADLFLSGFLGIDFKTRGLACYRLLDAAVTFHRELPKVGELIRYDIQIDHFFRQGDTHLFRFRFDGTINGEPLLTMRDGCAGFFTAAELAAGKGVVHTALDLAPVPGKRPDGWAPPVPLRDEALTGDRLDALRAGDLVAAFGAEFARARLQQPMRLPGGMLKLLHRVERIEPAGGRYGLGRIRCEADIHPGDWFLTCHFVDDQVMPGTLMYECCLHTLRVLLMRMGWVAGEREARFEPVPGVASRLRCRGQVIATTKKVTYEVALKEIGFRP
ncbi:MAG TPA: beta-ketoacyl synthase N-terminal-like domain-containing protein, partial [Gemmataceae bacterium]|nr:beta-ketoacyl synthase N-terminal-like domain-containing protein [Gemmataceae bacterium]